MKDNPEEQSPRDLANPIVTLSHCDCKDVCKTCREHCFTSCQQWLFDHWPLPVVDSLYYYCRWMLKVDTNNETHCVRIPIADNVILMALDTTDWPIELADGSGKVVHIIRETVEETLEEEQARRLAKRLEKNDDWRNFIALLCKERDDPHDNHYFPIHNHYVLENVDPLGSMQAALRRHGLPGTAATAKYAFWRLDHELTDTQPTKEHLPSRGIFVTTFCVLPTKSYSGRKYGQALTQMNFDPTWIPDTLVKTAIIKTREHSGRTTLSGEKLGIGL